VITVVEKREILSFHCPIQMPRVTRISADIFVKVPKQAASIKFSVTATAPEDGCLTDETWVFIGWPASCRMEDLRLVQVRSLRSPDSERE
jgi:hypothetical protein